MGFLTIIGVSVAEFFAAGLALSASVLVFTEWRRSRQPHLIFAAGALLAASLAAAAPLCAQAVSIISGVSLALAAAVMTEVFAWFHAVGVALTAAAAYSRRRSWWLLATIGAAAALILSRAISLLMLPATSPQFALFFELPMATSGAWLSAASLLLALSAVTYRRKHAAGAGARPDLFLSLAGLFGINAAFFFGPLVMVIGPLAAVIGYFFVAFYLVSFCLGAAAKWHQDAAIAAAPTDLVCRRLELKTAIVYTAVFWAVMLPAVAAMVFFFSRAQLAEKESVLERETARSAADILDLENSAMAGIEQLAVQPAFREAMSKAAAGAPVPEYSPAFVDDLKPLLRVFDRKGVIIWSSVSSAEIGGAASGSAQVKAVSGFRVAAVEPEPAMNDRLMLQVGVPVVFADGRTGAIAASVELVMEALEPLVVPPPASVFLAGGLPVVQRGEIDLDQAVAFAAGAIGQAVVSGRLADGSLAAAETVFGPDGRRIGSVVMIVPAAALFADAARSAYLCLFLMTVAYLALLLVLIIGLRRAVVRPINRLIRTARSAVRGGKDGQIELRSPDELGELTQTVEHLCQATARKAEGTERSLQDQADYLTNIVGEMQGPINVFRWTTDMLRFGDAGRLNKEQLDMVEQINQTTGRLSALIRNLSDTADFLRGRLTLKLEPAAIVEIIDRAAGVMAGQIREKNLAVVFSRPTRREPVVVRGDRERLYQVVLNLLANAVKYTDRNGRIRIGVEVVRRRVNDRLVDLAQISVEDNGRGIPRDQQADIFRQFFRARNAVKESVEGAGLGLYIVKSLVELHGGEIWVESEENIGSTFHFTVPLAS